MCPIKREWDTISQKSVIALDRERVGVSRSSAPSIIDGLIPCRCRPCRWEEAFFPFPGQKKERYQFVEKEEERALSPAMLSERADNTKGGKKSQ